MTAYRTQLRDAVAGILASPLGIVPTTTVSSNIGDSTVTATSPAAAAPFMAGGLLTFWDGTAESPYIIDHVTGALIYLDLTGHYDSLGNQITGLTSAHTNALIATNLVQVPPDPDDDSLTQRMLANGYPVVHVYLPDSTTTWIVNMGTQDMADVEVCYQLPVTQSLAPWMHAAIWTKQQHDRADGDLDALKLHLKVDFTIGGTSMMAKRLVQALAKNTANAQAPLWEQYMAIFVEGPYQ